MNKTNRRDTNNIFFVLSDKFSMGMLKHMATNGGWHRDDLITALTPMPTMKQFYTRTEHLKKIGLIRRENRKYSLTVYGRLVIYSIQFIEKGCKNQQRLNILEEFRKTMAPEEWKDIVIRVIDDPDLSLVAFAPLQEARLNV